MTIYHTRDLRVLCFTNRDLSSAHTFQSTQQMDLSLLKTTRLVAVIGTAGRGKDSERLRPGDYDLMYEILLKVLPEKCEIISGGAAWADHLAVTLALDPAQKERIEHVTLELPSQFGDSYLDDEAGHVSNYYHHKFCYTTGINSLKELAVMVHHKAGKENVTINVGKGFFDRNARVAKADALVAFTFGNGIVPKDGGTANTVRKYFEIGGDFGRDFTHVDLNDFSVHRSSINPYLELKK